MDTADVSDSPQARPPRKARKVFLWVGIALLLLDGALAFGWWYFIIPLRHQFSAEWRRTHTDQELWGEIQKRVHRLQWFHDDFGDVGMRGGKEWAEWVVRHVKADEDLQQCRTGHKDEAMGYLTNQMAGHLGKDWIDWWEKNKAKSQEEWIRDGFAAKGLALHKPLENTDFWRLFVVLGHVDNEEGWYRYNAARLIAASNRLYYFDANEVPRDSFPDVCRGMGRYSFYFHPAGAGIPVNLDLGHTDDYHLGYVILEPRVTYFAYEGMAAVGIAGSALLALYFVRRRRIHRGHDQMCADKP